MEMAYEHMGKVNENFVLGIVIAPKFQAQRLTSKLKLAAQGLRADGYWVPNAGLKIWKTVLEALQTTVAPVWLAYYCLQMAFDSLIRTADDGIAKAGFDRILGCSRDCL